MRRIIASAAAIALMAGTASTAFAKDHDMPADSADGFGQPRADESYVIGGDTASPDAKDGGLEGDNLSDDAQSVEREPASPPKGKPVPPPE